MVELLTSPLALETFTFTWVYLQGIHAEFNRADVQEGLYYQKHSLRELDIVDRYGLMARGKYSDYSDGDRDQGLLPRFDGLTQEGILESAPVIEFLDDQGDEVVLIDGSLRRIFDNIEEFVFGDVFDLTRFKIGSVSDFHCLERVSQLSAYFLGDDYDEEFDEVEELLRLTDLLPESLVYLNLRNVHHPWVFAEINMLLQEKDIRTPKPRQIELTVSMSRRFL